MRDGGDICFGPPGEHLQQHCKLSTSTFHSGEIYSPIQTWAFCGYRSILPQSQQFGNRGLFACDLSLTFAGLSCGVGFIRANLQNLHFTVYIMLCTGNLYRSGGKHVDQQASRSFGKCFGKAPQQKKCRVSIRRLSGMRKWMRRIGVEKLQRLCRAASPRIPRNPSGSGKSTACGKSKRSSLVSLPQNRQC